MNGKQTAIDMIQDDLVSYQDESSLAVLFMWWNYWCGRCNIKAVTLTYSVIAGSQWDQEPCDGASLKGTEKPLHEIFQVKLWLLWRHQNVGDSIALRYCMYVCVAHKEYNYLKRDVCT